MKLNLFLLASVFAAFYLCEAGPLRLQKRAAFYIANETACVVDNIVYSSGDPIPTEDPCEACKCRPPGFACVLKECRVKPGCRAVRHVGQCCPEYLCGCEHNGRMYQDGEEIRDAKNPCYICHCQGSSIACAFVDCLFRGDCPPVYVPGECCPEYSNCTRRDTPENTPLKDNNPVPSLNLLPGLNDESIIVPEKIPTTQKSVSPTEIVTHPPTESPSVTEKSTEKNVPDVKISTEIQTEIPSSVSVENKPALIPGEKNFVEEAASSEIKKDASPQDESNDEVEKNDGNILLNSETEINKDEDFETTTLKLPVSSLDVIKDQEIKIASETEAGDKAEAQENQSESVTVAVEIPTTDKTVKNSAANNSKSLKLSEDENIPDNEKSVKDKETKTDLPIQLDIKTTETPAQPSTESSSKINSITSTKSVPESAENIAEESQVKPQSSLYSNGEKIKSETAETVTIVVHVKDKSKTTTETNLNTDIVTAESVTKTTQENLLNSKDELKSTEPVKDDKTTLVEINSKVSTSATEPNQKELSTLSPPTDEKPKDAESRSEKTDSSSEAPQNTVSNFETTYLKIEEVSSSAQDKPVTESSPSAEAKAEEEETEKEKTDNLKFLETKHDEPKVSESVQTTTVSETDLKTNKAKENQTKYEGTTEISAAEASATEIKAEVREDENQSDDKGEKTSTEKRQETAPEEKIATTTTQTEIKTESLSAEIESKEISSKNIEKTTVEVQKQKDEVTTESAKQDIKTSAQTETPKKDSE